MVHLSALIHATMQVSPNERRHNRANAEPRGRLLIKRKDSIMKISARNKIKGTVVKIQEGAVNGHATIEDEEGVRISGSITNESIEALGLKEGGNAVAIIKATDVMVAVD